MRGIVVTSLAFALTLASVARASGPEVGDDGLGGIGTDADPIINGEAAATSDWPQTGAIIIDAHVSFGDYGEYDMRMFICSSTLIAPDVVLLAAHCVDPDVVTYGYGEVTGTDIRWTRLADLTPWTGESIQEWPEDAVPAWDWPYHDDWDYASLQTGLAVNNDIALLFLDEALDSPYAYLPTPDEATQVEVGKDVVVVGWGQQVATDAWEQPPAGSFGFKQMGDSSIAEVADAEFQVGADAESVRKCHGDSGGPTFMQVETTSPEKWRLVGVTSHAYDQTDCDSKGGVDTRIDFYVDWIDQEMRDRCEDGTRAWCDVPGIIPPPEPDDGSDDDNDDDGDGDGSDDKVGGKHACGCDVVPSPVAALPLLALAGLVLRRRAR